MMEKVNENELKDLKEEIEVVFMYQFADSKEGIASLTAECSPFFSIMCC